MTDAGLGGWQNAKSDGRLLLSGNITSHLTNRETTHGPEALSRD